MTLLLFSASAFAAQTALDSAANYGSGDWTGTNGGTGFNAWSTRTVGSSGGGFFRGSSNNNAGGGGSVGINTSGNSLGMYAGGTSTANNLARVTRTFTAGSTPSSALRVGQIFTIDMDNGYINSGGIVGFALQNSSGNDVFKWAFTGGNSSYQINNVNASPTMAFTGNGMKLRVTLTSATAYSLQVTSPTNSGSPTTYSGSLLNPTGGQSIDRVILFCTGAGSGGDYDAFFNALSVTCPVFTVTSQPGSVTICSGNTANFTVAAANAATPTYQWQYSSNGGGAWNNVTDGTGGTTTSYTTPTLTDGTRSGYKYRCVVTDACGTSVNSDGNATLTVNVAPSISSSPSDQTVCATANATFSVTAAGTGLTYQWRKGGANISDGATGNGSTYSGATTANLTINGAVAGDAVASGSGFDCVVSGTAPCTSATSTKAGLTVTASAVIDSQPTAQTACSTPGTASFSVSVTAVNPTYQWRLNGVNLSNGAQGNGSTVSGATSATLSLSTLTSANTVASGSGYDCVVSSDCGSPVTSDRVSLTVSTVPSITGQPTAQTVCSSPGTASFSVTATGDGLTYQWRKNAVNLTDGAGISGATTATLSLSSLTAANTVAAGVGYDCVVSGTAPCASATSTRVALTVNTTPSISGNPADASTCLGSSASFTVTAAGTGITYQWRKNGANISNGATGNGSTYSGATTATLTIDSVQAADAVAAASGFDCVVSGTAPCTTATSTKAGLAISSPAAITAQPSNAAFCSGTTANLTVTASGTAPISYAWRKKFSGWGSSGAWTVTAGGGGTFIGNSDIATSSKSWGLFNNGGTVTTAIRTFNALTVGDEFQIDMDNGSIATGGTVGFGLRNASGQNMVEFYFIGGENFYKINSQAGSIATTFGYTSTGLRFKLTVTSSTTYSITLTKLSDNSTSGPYTGTFLTSGSIAQVRLFNSNGSNNGGSAYDCFFNRIKIGPDVATPFYEDDATSYSSLTTGVNLGNGPLANGATGTGSTISGATSSSLSISSFGASDEANYDVIVYNACGSELSSAASLSITTVGAAGSISGLTTVCPNQAGVTYSISSVSGATSYDWTVPSGATITAGQGTTSITVTFGSSSGNVGVTPKNGTCSGTAASQAVTVDASLGTPGAITGPTALCTSDATATYSIAAVSGATTYNWTVPSGATITSGSGTAQIVVNVASASSGTISVTAENACNTSSAATLSLTMSTTPSISASPSSTTVCSGSSVNFTATASGSGISYAWRKRGSGWGAGWTFTGSGQTIGTSTFNNSGDPSSNGGTDIGDSSWRLQDTGSSAVRNLPSALGVGQIFSIDMDNGNNGSSVGFGLRNSSGQNVIEFYHANGIGYTLNAGSVNGWSAFSFTRSGLNIKIKLTSSSTYQLTATRYSDGATSTATGTLLSPAGGQSITQLRLFNNSGQTGNNNYYLCFNNISFDGASDNGGNYSGSWGSGSDKGQKTLSNGGSISGATTASLTINPVSVGDAGDYDVVVYNACDRLTSSAATLTVNASPTAYSVTGGSGCSGSGVTVGLSGSQVGVNYQLYRGASTVGSPVAGTGSALGFGLQTVAGTYTIVATGSGSCTTDMTGNATVYTAPTISLGSNPTVQSGTTSANLTYIGTTGSPDQYSINYDGTAEAQGFVDVSNASLPASPIVLVVPGGAALGTYNATLTVRNSTTTCDSSSYAISVTVSATEPAPDAPVATAATSVNTTSFQANWNAAATATSYQLDVSTVNNFSSFVSGYNNLTVNATTRSVSGLTAGSTYYYRVRGVNNGGASDNSNIISVTLPQTAVIDIVEIPSNTTSTGTLSFDATPGANYEVYRSSSDPGGSMSWSQVDQLTAASSTETVTVPEDEKEFYRVVIAGQSPTASSSPIWGVIKPTVVPGGGLALVSPPLRTDLNLQGDFGSQMAGSLTVGSKVLVMSPGASPTWTEFTLQNGDTWLRTSGAGSYTLNAGQAFFVQTAGSETSVRIAGQVGNDSTKQNTLQTGYNLIGISEGKTLAASTAFNSASPIGDVGGDETLSDQVIVQNPDGSWRRLIRRSNGTWYDTANPNSTANTTLQLTPGQAYYYIRRGGSTPLTF